MLLLDSPRWKELNHVYGSAEDIPEKLRALRDEERIEWTTDSVLEEIAAAIYHQGDPNTGSYAAVPHLVDIIQSRSPAEQILIVLLTGWIEAARDASRPEIPKDLTSTYFEALEKLKAMAINLLSVPEKSWIKGPRATDLTYLFGAIAAFLGERELAIDLSEFELLKEAYLKQKNE